MNVSLASMLPSVLAAPEYRLADYRRWFHGANRGSGPMWAEYLSRNLIAEVPVMPVPMLLISGASDWYTPVVLVQEWFATVEAPQGKRMDLFDASGHAPFLTETAHFVETVRAFGAELAGGRAMSLPWLTLFGAALTVLAAMTSAGMMFCTTNWQKLEAWA